MANELMAVVGGLVSVGAGVAAYYLRKLLAAVESAHKLNVGHVAQLTSITNKLEFTGAHLSDLEHKVDAVLKSVPKSRSKRAKPATPAAQ